MAGTIADLIGDSPEVRRFHELRLAHEAAVRAARDAANAGPALEREVADLKERAIDLWSHGRVTEAEQTEEKLAQAERDLAVQPNQALGAERAALRALGELKTHSRENLPALLAAQLPACVADAERVDRAHEEIVAAEAAFDGRANVLQALVALADRGHDLRVPGLPQPLAREARRVLANGPTTPASPVPIRLT
jgi:hypothetical protein